MSSTPRCTGGRPDQGAGPTASKTLSYGGGVDSIGVTSGGAEKVYLVFYGSQWGTQASDSSGNLTFTGDTRSGAPVVQRLFKGLGTGGEAWSGVTTQYCDGPLVATGATSCPAGAAHVPYPTNGDPYVGSASAYGDIAFTNMPYVMDMGTS